MSNSSGRTRRPTAWRAPSAARRTTRPAPRRTSRPALASGVGPVPGTVPGTCPKAPLRVPRSLHLRTVLAGGVSRAATAEGLSPRPVLFSLRVPPISEVAVQRIRLVDLAVGALRQELHGDRLGLHRSVVAEHVPRRPASSVND